MADLRGLVPAFLARPDLVRRRLDPAVREVHRQQEVHQRVVAAGRALIRALPGRPREDRPQLQAPARRVPARKGPPLRRVAARQVRQVACPGQVPRARPAAEESGSTPRR